MIPITVLGVREKHYKPFEYPRTRFYDVLIDNSPHIVEDGIAPNGQYYTNLIGVGSCQEVYEPIFKKYNLNLYKEVDAELREAIKQWNFKQSLTPSTAKTFSDIIDEL